MMKQLVPLKSYQKPKGPVVLAIMDGVGIGSSPEGDCVQRASTPHLDWLKANALFSQLKAHGKAVGMPSDGDMGNSEVGHNAIGCGRVFEQGASLVKDAIDSRLLYKDETWMELLANCKKNKSNLHFIGLLSDGNVHTHIDHLLSMIEEAKNSEIKVVRIHILLDGRDVPPTSALVYVEKLEALLQEINKETGMDYAIASGGGRLKITMDRYGAEWGMVELGWQTHVKGDGPSFSSALEAIESHRKANPGVIDQDLPPFVIVKDGAPIGPITDGDSVILFNFRGDRAIEITQAFEEKGFDKFKREPNPDILFAGMMEYDADLGIPNKYLVSPPSIDRTMGEYLVKSDTSIFAISETQKYGHMTYFFNGNRSGKFDEALETYVEIPSDTIPFEQRPWMKAAEITDSVLEAIQKNQHQFIRINYPNGDMVGHTGDCLAVEISVEAVDLCIGRLIDAVKQAGGILIVSADHGNADEMYELDKKTGGVKYDDAGDPKLKTSHSLNPVPVFIYDPSADSTIRLSAHKDLGVSSLAATSLVLLGFEPPEGYDPSVVEV